MNPQPARERNADSFRADLHPDLKADFVPVWKDLANPPFNMSDWGGENLRQDVRCFPLSASLGERAGVRGESYSGDPSKELSIHGVEKTDETCHLYSLNLAAA